MLKSISHIVTIILLSAGYSLNGQDTLTVIMTDQLITDESQVTVPVFATHFDAISYFQLSINWDSTRFAFNGINDINLNGLKIENFSVNQVESGKVGMNWIDPNSQATTIADTVSVFAITFDVISDNRDDAKIIFGDDPTDLEAGDVNGNESPLKGIGANIVFEQQSTSVDNLGRLFGFSVDQNNPNPFQEETLISFEIAKSEEVLFEVFDMEGKRIIRKESQFPQGNNYIRLNKLQLNGAGVYQYSLSIKQKTITKKLILLN